MSKLVLLHHPDSHHIAESLVRIYPAAFHPLDKFKIQWNWFPDGWPNITFPTDCVDQDVVFILSMQTQQNMLEQMSLMMAMPRHGYNSITFIVPWFGPGTMERAETPGTLATAETTAVLMTRCIPPQSGTPKLIVLDVHSFSSQFNFCDTVLLKWESYIPQFVKHLQALTPGSFQLCMPDDGAYKRFRALLAPYKFPTIICSKMREANDKRVIRIIDRINYPENDKDIPPHVIIIDDLVQSGNTLDECRKALADLPFVQFISAYVTHAIFPQKAYEKFSRFGPIKEVEYWKDPKHNGFLYFWMTDSNPHVTGPLFACPPFMVLPLAPRLYSLLDDHKFRKCRIFSIGTKCKAKVDGVLLAQHLLGTWSDSLRKAQIFLNNIPPQNSSSSPSGVNPQPFGADEIRTGAENRVLATKKRMIDEKYGMDKGDLIVEIENGLVRCEERWFDIGCVAVMDSYACISHNWTRMRPIPERFNDRLGNSEKEAREKWNQAKTVGMEMSTFAAENALPELSPQDWHAAMSFTGVPRAKLIADALIPLTLK